MVLLRCYLLSRLGLLLLSSRSRICSSLLSLCLAVLLRS